MQLVMLFIIGMVFVINFSSQSFAADKKTKAEPKRTVAQEVSKPQGPYKGKCIPLGETKLQLFDDETYQYLYDLEEMRMLRNSIFAQYGFQFKDEKIAAEMVKRGCVDHHSGKNYKKMDPIDTANVNRIKSHEASFKSDLRKNNFDQQWASESGDGRVEMLKGHYCYLLEGEKQKLKGVIYFNSKKQKESKYKLEAMMSPSNPPWAVKTDLKEEYSKKLNNKDLDVTDLGSLFEYNHSGNWFIDNKEVHINLPSDGVNNATAVISGEFYKDKEVLICKY